MSGLRHLTPGMCEVLGPMLPALFASGSGPRGGRPAVDDLVCLDAVVDLARGTRWRDIRTPSHGVSRDTVLRRLRFRVEAGVLAETMDLPVLRGVLGGALGLSRISLDSRSIRAEGESHTGPNPTDRGKPGVKHPLMVERAGTPPACLITPANAHDGWFLRPLVQRVARRVGGLAGCKARADKGYDQPRNGCALAEVAAEGRIARKKIDAGGLDRRRWVVERSFGHPCGLHRLERRCERDPWQSTSPSSRSAASSGSPARSSTPVVGTDGVIGVCAR